MNFIQNNGQLLNDNLLQEIRDKFHHVDFDPITNRERIYFDNAGGSFRLKSVSDIFSKLDALPDCSERQHQVAKKMNQIEEQGLEDIKLILNADSGSLVTSLTASMVIYEMTRVIAENIKGTNIVTTALEHPSAFDSAKFYADKLGKELRIAKTNKVTGGVDVEEIVKLIDENTCMLSVIYASNISGSILDIESIVKETRKVKPDLFIICDAVQHAPHGIIDLKKTPVDAINFAPYKFFGTRGLGIGFLSERAAKLPHHKLLAKSEETWELGSPAPAHFAAISEIVDYVCWIGKKFSDSNDRRELFTEGMERIKLHERALMHFILNGSSEVEGLRHIKGVTVHLDYEDLTKRDLILAISFDNLEYNKAVREYEKHGVIVFERVATSLYSVRMLESFGLKGAVRISPLHCHNTNDIKKFLEVTKTLSTM